MKESVPATETPAEAPPRSRTAPLNASFEDLLAPLAAISHSMQEAFDPRRFLAEFSMKLQRLIPHDRLLIPYLEDGGETVSIFAEHAVRGSLLHDGRYTIDFDPAGRYAPDDLAIGPVCAGNVLLTKDVHTDPHFSPALRQRIAARVGLRSRVAVPLYSGGGVIGGLLVGSRAQRAYDDRHVAICRHVADLIAPFVENIVRLHRERRRRRRLRDAAALVRVFGASLDVQEIFTRLAEAARPILEFSVMAASLLSPSGRDLEFLATTSRVSRAGRPAREPLDHFSFGAQVEAGETVRIRDASRELDPGRPGDRRILDQGVRSTLCVPLRFGEHVGGLLFFGKDRPYWFSAADAEIAEAIAAQVVMAIQHQRMADDQRRLALIEGRAQQLEQRVASLQHTLGERYGFERLIGRAPSLLEALSRAAKVAPTEATVFLSGESGTGKELVARAVHAASPRALAPFSALNCATLPDTLVESELFGHERGAFTGADRQKPGRFEVAAGGTLFLDEITELSLAVQAKLLRVLQEREYQRVGGTATLRADVRLIAATNRELEREVAAGRFREDLYYRLNVFRVHLPPLRERGEDVLLLADHFVRTLGAKIGRGEPGLSADARALLLTHQWPGNIRELQNAIERALIVSDGGLLIAAHFGLAPTAAPRPEGPLVPAPRRQAAEPLAEIERGAILEALDRAHGNKSRAAKSLGITRTKLYTRLRHHGLDRA